MLVPFDEGGRTMLLIWAKNAGWVADGLLYCPRAVPIPC